MQDCENKASAERRAGTPSRRLRGYRIHAFSGARFALDFLIRCPGPRLSPFPSGEAGSSLGSRGSPGSGSYRMHTSRMGVHPMRPRSRAVGRAGHKPTRDVCMR